MMCTKCTKYLRPKDGNYAKMKFGTVLCISCSPMKKYDSKGKVLPDVEPEATVEEQDKFLEEHPIADLPFI